MAEYGKQIIDWAIRDAETVYEGQIALIVGDRYGNKTPADGDGLTLQFFVPRTPEAEGIAKAFVIEDLGYDYFGVPWERLERTAALKEGFIRGLAESEVLWADTPEDEKRFYALRETLFKNLQNPAYTSRILAWRLENAMEIYKTLAFEDDLCAVRKGAVCIGLELSEALAAVNGTYLKRGEIGTVTPLPLLKTLRHVPEGFIEALAAVTDAKGCETLRALSHTMVKSVRGMLQGLVTITEPIPEPGYLLGWYEESLYTWRRIAYFCKEGDAENALGWGVYLQQEFDIMQGIFAPERADLLSAFDQNDLAGFAAHCESVRKLVRGTLIGRGIKMREYGSLSDFLEENTP